MMEEKVAPRVAEVHDSYLSLFQREAVPWNHGKIVLLGDGRAGKDSTFKSLRGLPFDANQPSTRGAALESIAIRRQDMAAWEQDDQRALDMELELQVARLLLEAEQRQRPSGEAQTGQSGGCLRPSSLLFSPSSVPFLQAPCLDLLISLPHSAPYP